MPASCASSALCALCATTARRSHTDSLDVEQLGEAYEAMLGFTIVRAGGPSIALKPRGITIRLDDLLAVPPAKRRAWLQRSAACRLSIAEHRALLQANAPAAAAEALKQKTSPHTPRPLPAGSLLLQPTEARRRSGSHYTPRELTTPIVETALRPVLERLGPNPTPAQLLSLKVCDPAMGAGAFLLEACRQLARHLTRAGQQHGTPVTDARRLVAQHCLYGVDKNPVAAQLAKLSLWMMAGSSQLPFTFADHALKHGDSLVGLGREQLGEAAIASARLKGDLLVSVRFAEKNAAARAARREECLGWWQAGELEKVHAAVATLRETVVPLHWEVEFPDVFGRDTPGFDVIVGNPPFLGGGRISQTMGAAYLDVLRGAFHGAGGQVTWFAYFFRRACQLAAPGGCIGFVATNTLAQGDTRQAGLQHICQHGGTIYSAVRRLWWPGTAAVVVSVVHVCWKPPAPLRDVRLDGQAVGRISAFLCHTGGDEAPRPLRANAGLSFKGSLVYGMGFIFDDRDDKGRTSSVEEMRCLVARDPRNAERIFPYIGGHEVNWSPTHTPTDT